MRRKLPALLMILILLVMSFAPCAYAEANPTPEPTYNPASLTEETLYSEAAILIDADSGDVLFSKNDQVRMHPASTTKIMTALLAIESGIPMDQVIAVPQAAKDIPKDSSLVPVYPGEHLTFYDLVLGFMLHSGNDAGNAIAVLVSGSVKNFVALMNQRAAELGCTGTKFANAHGYTADGHYTTAYDLALITKTAMENETFRQIVNQTDATIHVQERGEIKLKSKHMVQRTDSQYYYDGCIGVKTGTTSAAGECFVGAAERDGATIISVALNCSQEKYRWADTWYLFEYGWTCYDTYSMDQMYKVASPRIGSFVISNAADEDIAGGELELDIAQISNTDYVRMVERANPNALNDAVNEFISSCRVQITHNLTAPISVGEIMGDFSYTDPMTGVVTTAKLVASRDVAERIIPPTLLDYLPFLKIFQNRLFIALLVVIALLIFLLIVLGASRKAAKERRRRQIYEQKKREYMRRQQMQARAASAGKHASASAAARPVQKSASAGRHSASASARRSSAQPPQKRRPR